MRICSLVGCDNSINANNKTGYCRKHRYPSSRQNGRVCAFEGCDAELRIHNKQGYCRKHRHLTSKQRERGRIWYRANSVRRSFTIKAWKEANTAKVKADNDAWYEANKERKKATNRVWYEANKDQKQAVAKIWRENNPERARFSRQKRRVVLKDIKSDLVLNEWLEILVEYEGKCFWCGNEATAMDHIVSILPRKGGQQGFNTKNNVVPSCKSCNSHKHNKDPLVFLFELRQAGYSDR